MKYYIYYSYEQWGRGYIGAKPSGSKDPMNDGYYGSYSDKLFSPTEKIILGVFDTPEEAMEAETLLHAFFEVDINPHFANKARQTSSKFIRTGPQSESEKLKKRQAMLGRTLSETHREAISNGKKGKKATEEHKKALSKAHANVSGENNPMFGRTFSHTWEAKEKIGNAARGRKKSKETLAKMRGRKDTEETLTKKREAQSLRSKEISDMFKKLKWFNNGEVNVRKETCPEGFFPGRMKRG